MNFIKAYKQGKEGKNIGLSTGLPQLDQAINKIQRKMTISVAAAPKVGKTTLTDFCFVLSPYLEALEKGTLDKVEWIYYSYEIDRISKEFKFAAFFMAYDYKISEVKYKDKIYPMSQDYLMGKLIHRNPDDTLEIVPVEKEHEDCLKLIYTNRIVPLFGEFDERGKRISKGKITFIEDPDNPTGLYKSLMKHATINGTFLYEPYEVVEEGKLVKKQRIVGYTPNDPEKFTIIVTDHIRKLKRERGFTMKDNIDKYLEYTTWIRNMCSYTFVHIVHMNRGLANVERLKFAVSPELGHIVYPTGDDVKDSGNISEESTVLLTMFNPQDEKYNITKHFGLELAAYPNYRSIHLADSRYTECPKHIQTNMYGGINLFTPIKY